MNIFERISKVDSRVIFTLLWVIMAFALIRPLGLPIKTSANTQKAYDWINENIKEGDIVLVSFDYDFGNMAENYTGQLAVMRMAFERNARIITTSMWASGGMVAGRAIEEIAKEFPDKVKGVDYLHLGYKPGGETYISALMENAFTACANVDDDNKLLTESPIMKDFPNLSAAKLVCTGGSGSPGANEWVKMFAAPTGKPYIGQIESVSVPGHAQNLQAGYMTAMIPGMRGSAEMEQLTGVLGMSSSAMDAQALVHVFVFILIALGNANYFMTRKKEA